MSGSLESRIARRMLDDGSAIVPPRLARWLEKQADMTADRRSLLRSTDIEAYEVLTALHLSALVSDCGTNGVARQRDTAPLGEWMSTGDAARELHVTDRSVRNWCTSGRLPAVMSGGRWLIRRTEVTVHTRTV